MKRPGLILQAALLPLLVSCSQVPGTMSPNIVLVFIDDMGWADWSCFGNEDASTPNIDRMAAEGISFEQFYVNAPICSPSRVAISTGQYPQRWGITSYLAYRRQNQERGMPDWLDPLTPMPHDVRRSFETTTSGSTLPSSWAAIPFASMRRVTTRRASTSR